MPVFHSIIMFPPPYDAWLHCWKCIIPFGYSVYKYISFHVYMRKLLFGRKVWKGPFVLSLYVCSKSSIDLGLGVGTKKVFSPVLVKNTVTPLACLALV